MASEVPDFSRMFEHEMFDKYDLDSVPLNRDTYLIDEIYAKEYEEMYLGFLDGKDYDAIGYVSYVAVNRIFERTLELSWYPNILDRFHELPVILPKSVVRVCVDCLQYDWKPTLFVDSDWLAALYAKTFSAFCIVDAASVKNALRSDSLDRNAFIALRNATDKLAEQYPDVAFVSFGDSILAKVNWTVGSVHNDLTYTYAPEELVEVAKKLCDVVTSTLGLPAYAILSQGYNEFWSDELVHLSSTSNHFSMNSLGTPFAQILAIDEAAREAIRSGAHTPHELYMDSYFYHSLRFSAAFDKNDKPRNGFRSPMSAKAGFYFYSDFKSVLDGLSAAASER